MIEANNFSELKERILASARIAQACREQYGRAYSSETAEELMEVIKDNFHWCVGNEVLTVPLIEEYKWLFSEHGIHCNESVDSGYLLADSATVRACGSATVEACGSATVRAWDSATVRAWDSATVEAWDSATVRAWGNATVRASGNATVQASGNATVQASGNATVEAWDSATVQASGNATVRASGNATVEAWGNATVQASGNATVEAWGNATVQASGNAYITSYDIIECRLSDKAIYRIRGANTIRFASDALKFEMV